jgi:hypothetical protein
MKHVKTFENFAKVHENHLMDESIEFYQDQIKSAGEDLERVSSNAKDGARQLAVQLKKANASKNEKEIKDISIRMKFGELEDKGKIMAATAKLQMLQALIALEK